MFESVFFPLSSPVHTCLPVVPFSFERIWVNSRLLYIKGEIMNKTVLC